MLINGNIRNAAQRHTTPKSCQKHVIELPFNIFSFSKLINLEQIQLLKEEACQIWLFSTYRRTTSISAHAYY